MGLNAYFAYTAVPYIAAATGSDQAWKIALGAVFFSGCIFMVLTFTRIRVMIINAVPQAIKVGIAAGIGIFIAMIGLQYAGIIVASESTMVSSVAAAIVFVAISKHRLGARLELIGEEMGDGLTFEGTLPSTQDYIVALTSRDQPVTYRLEVIIQ